jgi:hypothetical protein
MGISGAAYVYDYFGGTATRLDAGGTYSTTVSDGSYFVVAPVGPSGIALVGDGGEFASLGLKRISALSDTGALDTTVEFAAGENAVTLIGYAPSTPTVATTGSVDPIVFDAPTGRFTVVVHADTTPASVKVQLTL